MRWNAQTLLTGSSAFNMDYFARGHNAHRLGWIALLLAGAGVLATSLFFAALIAGTRTLAGWVAPGHDAWDARLVFWVFLAHAAIGAGCAWRRVRAIRRGGGGAVEARRLGATPCEDPTGVLRTTTAEFAVAVGAPVPRTFEILADDVAINVLSIGVRPTDAVIVFSRGALDQLSDGEIRAAVAHEMTRIVDGDMRLGLQIAIVTQSLLIPTAIARYCASRSRKAIRWALVLPRWIATLLGSPGRYAAQAVPGLLWRHRGAGADAPSLILAGDPHGLASLLARTRPSESADHRAEVGATATADLRAVHALEFAHACLAPMRRRGPLAGSALFRTHPSFGDRTRLIGLAHAQIGEEQSYAQANLGQMPLGVDEAFDRSADFDAHHVRRGRSILKAIPEPILAALAQPAGCHAIACAVLTRGQTPLQQAQHALFEQKGCPDAVREAEDLHPHCADLDEAAWIAIADLAQPTLHEMTSVELGRFQSDLLMLANGSADSFAFFAAQVWLHHIRAILAVRPGSSTSLRVFARGDRIHRGHWHDLVVLLLTIARISNWDPRVARRAFGDACKPMGVPAGKRVYGDIDERVLEHMPRALALFEHLAIQEQRRLVYACLLASAADTPLEPREIERVRAVARALGCVIPPQLDLASSRGATPSTDFERALSDIWKGELAGLVAGS